MATSAHTHRAAKAAARQHGNLSYAQLRDCGLSEEDIKHRSEIGWLIRRHQEVYAVGHVPQTFESTLMAAVLALGEGALASHRAAALLWGLTRRAAPIEVTAFSDTGRRDRDEIKVHRNRFRDDEATVHRAIPVTTVLRTVLDCGAVLQGRRLAAVLEEAQVRYGLAPELVAAECLSRRGYRGNARIGTLLAGAVEPARVRSVLELRFLALCERFGIARPLVNEMIGPWEVDFLWPAQRLVVETDGYAFHRTAAARERDRRRDEYLGAIGLRVVRVTWTDVADRAAQTAAKILTELRVAA